MSNNGRRYNNEFKKEIIRLITEEKRTVSSVVKDFGVNSQTVSNWLKDNRSSQNPDKVKILELESELRDTKRKLADSEVTIDILKKATAIFVQNNRK